MGNIYLKVSQFLYNTSVPFLYVAHIQIYFCLGVVVSSTRFPTKHKMTLILLGLFFSFSDGEIGISKDYGENSMK